MIHEPQGNSEYMEIILPLAFSQSQSGLFGAGGRRWLPIDGAVHYHAHLVEPPLRSFLPLLAAAAAVGFGPCSEAPFHLFFIPTFIHLSASLAGGVGQKRSNPKDFLSFILEGILVEFPNEKPASPDQARNQGNAHRSRIGGGWRGEIIHPHRYSLLRPHADALRQTCGDRLTAPLPGGSGDRRPPHRRRLRHCP